MIPKKLLIVGAALVLACTDLAVAVPDALECRTVGGTNAGAPDIGHTWDIDTAGTLTVVYDQCLQHLIDDLASGGTVLNYNEYGAGIDGAAFASVAASNPYGDSRVGGTQNCWGPNFDGHHGVDTIISTADDVEQGNIRVFITADIWDTAGEALWNATGGPNGDPNATDIRDPCGDNSIDATDNFIVVDPCALSPHVQDPDAGQFGLGDCHKNWYTFDTTQATRASSTFDESGRSSAGATLSDNAGLDGGVWTFIGISTGNGSAAASGITFTVPDPYHCEAVVLGALYRCSGTYARPGYRCYGSWYSSPGPSNRPGTVITETCDEWPPGP